MNARLGLVLVLLLAALGLPEAGPSPPRRSKKPPSKPRLKKTEGKKWQRLAETIATAAAKQAAKSSTSAFVRKRDQRLVVPVDVDILMLGFNGDGGFDYKMSTRELEELLTTAMHEEGGIGNEVCPTIWETGERSKVCYSVTYNMLTVPEHQGTASHIQRLETVLRQSFRKVGAELQDKLGGGRKTAALYEIEAQGHVEDAIYSLVQEAYHASNLPLPAGSNAFLPMVEHRSVIVVLNPNKIRMNPAFQEHEAAEAAARAGGFLEQWRDKAVDITLLEAQEAGYTYWYRYNGRGAAASWISEFPYVLIDLAAGPVSYGPMIPPSGGMAPTSLPRLMPMMLRMALELKDVPPGHSQHFHAWEEAGKGQSMLFTGQLASTLAAATKHVMCPDVASQRVEYASQVLVTVLAIHDHPDLNPLTTGYDDKHAILDMYQLEHTIGRIVDAQQTVVVESRGLLLHKHKAVAAALQRARVYTSDPVMMSAPDLGMHKTNRVYLDSRLLLDELLAAIPQLTDNEMMVLSDEESDELIELDLAAHARHQGTRVLPVFVISLSAGPDQLLLDNQQLVAATPDGVVVIQAWGKENQPDHNGNVDDSDGRLLTGHLIGDMQVRVHSISSATANMIAGVAMSLAGVVPPYERHSPTHGERVQDWRWAVGATPWGPYANSTMLSDIITAVARRNTFVSHAEIAFRALQSKLDEVDELVSTHLAHPFTFLSHGQEGHAQYHWLDALAEHSHGFNGTLTETAVARFEADLASIQTTIEQASLDLYANNYEGAEAKLPTLLALVDSFRKRVGEDLAKARDVLECCSLRHSRSSAKIVLPFEVVLVLIIMCVFSLLAFVALRSEKVARIGVRLPSSGGARREPPRTTLLPR